jgi:hypothetical protein
MCHC